MRKLAGNVISNDEFKTLMNETLDYVASAVAETFGPYGHNALIQTTNTVYSTKDGFHTLQNISCGDPIRAAIKYLIESVAQSIVLSVGDGSTTSIMAANRLNQILNTEVSKCSTTIRDLENSLVRCVDMISDKLYENATVIDDSNLRDAIYKIAMVSTNWDEVTSNMIADIYQTTHNPIIKIDESGTDKTVVEYIEGYDLAGSLMLKEYYANDREHNKAVVKNPVILVFNHNVQAKYFLSLSCLAQLFELTNRQVVILAPDFETTFIAKLSATNNGRIRERKSIINLVPCKVINYYNIDRDCIRDFCTLTGAVPISVDDENFNGMMDDLATSMMYQPKEGTSQEEINKKAEERQIIASAAIQYIDTIAGQCNILTISEKSLVANGLPGKDSEFIEDIKTSIRTEIDYKIKECDAKTILTDDIRMKRIRLAKLNCIMGVIKVGGYGSANLKAKKDALDDATRACEAAYRDGYNMGGCLSILRSIDDIKQNNDELTPVDEMVLSAMFDAFAGVFKRLFINKYGDNIPTTFDVSGTEYNMENIIRKCINNGIGFDIINMEFDTNDTVINPVNVDVEALRACMRLIIISVTTSQFIFKDYDPSTGDKISLKEV